MAEDSGAGCDIWASSEWESENTVLKRARESRSGEGDSESTC